MQSPSSREPLFRWLLALGCFAAVIFFFSPCWGAFTLWARVPEMSGLLEVRRGASVLEQAAHPGVEISDPLHRAIQWRLLFPLIGHLLSLPSVLLFGLAYVGCVLVFGYLATLLRRAGYTWVETALASVSLGAASWMFVSTGWLGYYDSWLALALLLVGFARSPWTVAAACIWAPWVDERFVVAVPLALLCRWLMVRSTPATASPDTISVTAAFDWRRDIGIPAALLAVFLFIRLGLLSTKSAADATIVGYFSGKNYLDAPPGRILLGVWDGLRTGWMFVALAVLALRRQPALAALLAVAVLLMIAGGLATAQDYSRSMTMLLPVAMLGLLLSPLTARPRRGHIFGTAAALALILPAHHVMNDRVNPIFYLYRELYALESPPAAAMPELHELRAIHEMEQGDFAQAESDLTLAIKLSTNTASAAKQRGVLYASQQRWDEAKRDFTTVVEVEPDNPDGWFLRSQVELAMHDLAASRADFDHAQSIAPAGWSRRPDVTRFTATLNRQTSRP